LVWDCDALLMRNRVAVCVRNIKAFLFWNRMAFGNGYLVWNWLTFCDRNGCTELLWDRMTLSISKRVAFMMRNRVAFRPFDWMALSSRFGIWHIDALLVWNRFAFLKRNLLTDLLWNSVALDLISNLVTVLFIYCGTYCFFICFTCCLVEANALRLNGNFKCGFTVFFFYIFTNKLRGFRTNFIRYLLTM